MRETASTDCGIGLTRQSVRVRGGDVDGSHLRLQRITIHGMDNERREVNADVTPIASNHLQWAIPSQRRRPKDVCSVALDATLSRWGIMIPRGCKPSHLPI